MMMERGDFNDGDDGDGADIDMMALVIVNT